MQPVKITTIARGIAFGGELEYADEMTLARSISNRIPVENYVGNKFFRINLPYYTLFNLSF